jgi:hypothetical protein
MSTEINDLIHTNARSAYNQGVARERQRVLAVLQPHAEHDDWCENGGCYPEDCSAPVVQYLIQKILETDLQDNVNISEHKQ